jgi:hypothetical protein
LVPNRNLVFQGRIPAAVGRFRTSMIGNRQGKTEISHDGYLSWMSRFALRIALKNGADGRKYAKFTPGHG